MYDSLLAEENDFPCSKINCTGFTQQAFWQKPAPLPPLANNSIGEQTGAQLIKISHKGKKKSTNIKPSQPYLHTPRKILQPLKILNQ